MITILSYSPIYQPLSNESYSPTELEQIFPNFFESMESESAYLYKCLINLMKQYPYEKLHTNEDQRENFAKWMRFIVYFIRLGHNHDTHTIFRDLPVEFQSKIQNILEKLI